MTQRVETILSLLLAYVHNIEDLLSLLSVSHSIRSVTLENLTPPKLYRICHQSLTIPAFSPGPWYLLSLIAYGISQWMRESNGTRIVFKKAYKGRPEGLVELGLICPSISTLSNFKLEKLRRFHEKRYSIINPLTDLLDKCIGAQWFSLPNFWEQAEDAATLFAVPNENLFQMIVYGELFGRGLKVYLDWVLSKGGKEEEVKAVLGTWDLPPNFSHQGISTRMEFIKYCLPDWRTPWVHRPNSCPNVGVNSSYPSSPTADPPPLAQYVSPVQHATARELIHPPVIHPLRAIQQTGSYCTPESLGQAEGPTCLTPVPELAQMGEIDEDRKEEGLGRR